MKLSFLYVAVILCIFCKATQRKTSGGFLFQSSPSDDSNRKRKSLDVPLFDLGFSPPGKAEERPRERRDAQSLELDDTPDENAWKGGERIAGDLSGNEDTGVDFGTKGTKGSSWSSSAWAGSGSKTQGFGLDSSSSGEKAWKGGKRIVGDLSGNAETLLGSSQAEGFGTKGTKGSGWSGSASAGSGSKTQGFGLDSSGSGENAWKGRKSVVGDLSGNAETLMGSSLEEGFGTKGTKSSSWSSSAWAVSGFKTKGFGLDSSGSGENSWKGGKRIVGDLSGNAETLVGSPLEKGFGTKGTKGSGWSGSSSAVSGSKTQGFGLDSSGSEKSGSQGWSFGTNQGSSSASGGVESAASGSLENKGSQGKGAGAIAGGSSKGSTSKELGQNAWKGEKRIVGDLSGNADTRVGSSQEESFGTKETKGSGWSGSASAGSGSRTQGFGLDSSGSVKSGSQGWSFGSNQGSSSASGGVEDAASGSMENKGSQNKVGGTIEDRSSKGSTSKELGENAWKGGKRIVGDLSGNAETLVGSSQAEGFGTKGTKGSSWSSSAWAGSGSKTQGFGLDSSGSGENTWKGGKRIGSDLSGNADTSVVSTQEEGFGNKGIKGSGWSSSASAGSGSKTQGFGLDSSGTVGKFWSSDFDNGESKGEGSFDFGDPASSQHDDSDLSVNGVKGITSLFDYSTSGPSSTTEKGSHIPEATPTYSETNEIIGEASTWGKGAYKTFDGRIFSIESSCDYTFCRHCVESGGDFNIEIKRNNESEIEKITIIIDNNEISIWGDIILVNGESVQIPFDNKLIHIKKYGEHCVLSSRRGILTFMWNKNSKLSLTLHKQYPTCGLCGSFNSTPENINELIANSKIPGDCPEAVSKVYEVCEDGVQLCSRVIGRYFERCAQVAALARDFALACADELCSAGGRAPCHTLSELARLCAADGPGPFEAWRQDPDLACEKPSCPDKHIYKECGPSNPATCSNVAPFQDSECVSGCTCPEAHVKKLSGLVLKHCVLEDDKDWSVSVELRPCPSGQSGTCLSSVTLALNSSVSVSKHVFNSDGTVTNDKIINQHHYYSDEVQISKISSSYFQVETYSHVKMQIQTDPVMQLYVSMPPNQFTDTVGLCGSYNNRVEDDFMSSQNILEKTSQAFASSWEMMPCPKGTPSSCISIEKGNYVKACAEKKTHISEWRSGRCELSCPSGLVFKYNVKACNSSCRSLSERDRSCDLDDVPVDGCTCADGMYRNNEGNCVPKSQCDCYLNDEVMQPGKLIHIDDNKWRTCPANVDATVQKEWFEILKGSVFSLMIAHVHLVDENMTKGVSPQSADYCGGENGTFRILTESVPCCEDGLTCSRKIIVAFQDQNVVLHDGKVTAVKTTDNKDCDLNGNSYSVHTVGLYLIVKFVNGVTVIWDKNTRMSVILDPQWNGKVCGLCGNNNGDLKDDFTTRYSSVAAGALEFGNSWKTSQECSDTVAQTFPCDSNPYCKAWAVRKCEIIRDSTFRECHSKVDPSTYYEACIEEACACDMEGKYQGFCTAVAMYAEACSAVGICVTWRKPDLCPVYCDYYNAPGECSWHYEPCGSVTAKTCKDRVIGQKFSALLEGCYAKCPDSAPYLDENTMKCVRLPECSCFYNDIIPAGGVIQDNCGRTCYCIAGELECSGTTGSSTEISKAIDESVVEYDTTRPSVAESNSETTESSVVGAATTGSSTQNEETTRPQAEGSATTGTSMEGSRTTSSNAPGSKTTRSNAAGTGTTRESSKGSQTTGSLSKEPETTGSSVVGAATTGSSPQDENTTGPVAGGSPTMGPSKGGSTTTKSNAAGTETTRESSKGSRTTGSLSKEPETTESSVVGAGTTGSSPQDAETTRPLAGGSATTGSSMEGSKTTRSNAAGTGTTRESSKGSRTTGSLSRDSETTGSSVFGSATTGSSPQEAETTGPLAEGSATKGPSMEGLRTTRSNAAVPPKQAEVTEATTSTEGASTTGAELLTGTTGIATGTTVAAGSSKTEATTSLEISETTRAEVAIGVTNIITGSQYIESKTGKQPGSMGATSSQEGSTVVSSDTTITPGSSNTGTSKKASEGTLAPGAFSTEPRTCLFNNTDYEIGASFDDPSNPCVSYTCHNTGFIAVVQDCPKQTWCEEEDRVYDSKKCCYTCKTNCKSSPVNVTIRYNGCKRKVEMARCTGECKKTVKYNYDIFQLENSCVCCKEENYEFRNIVLDCPDGSTAPY
nr:unnamed protein product [Sorex araneus]